MGCIVEYSLTTSKQVIDEDLQDNNQHFLSHADGATAILRSFGPERINSRFELQLFYAHVPTIVSDFFPSETPGVPLG